jgi:glycosyltransferase involved in cell wall biosynthesis
MGIAPPHSTAMKPPRITIVTPSFNQGQFIAETIESVAAQRYPDLEHIVMDGGSTDGTLEILQRYPHLVVVSERDKGQADAINKGFARATGDIWGFLNSDDTLLPGALDAVVSAIDPAQGRHLVVGRCFFIDEKGRSLGVEHPSGFTTFTRLLAVWKGHTIPQPAVFWTPEVWRRSGGMDLSLRFHLDYDLFCRFARHYRFHPIDQVLATYRLHAESKTEEWTEADRLEDSIRLSRRYWGSPLSPRRWQLTGSLAWHRFDRVNRARRLYLAGRERRRLGRPWSALPVQAAAAALAPGVAFYVGLYPLMRRSLAWRLSAALARRRQAASPDVQTKVYFSRSDPWPDGWIGPRFRLVVRTDRPAGRLTLRGVARLAYLPDGQHLTVSVDGDRVGEAHLAETGHFAIEIPLERPLPPGEHQFEVKASAYFVDHYFTGSGDWRPLSWRRGPWDIIEPAQ